MPIPSFRHLDDESLLLPQVVEAEADQTLATVRGVYRELGAGLAEAVY